MQFINKTTRKVLESPSQKMQWRWASQHEETHITKPQDSATLTVLLLTHFSFRHSSDNLYVKLWIF